MKKKTLFWADVAWMTAAVVLFALIIVSFKYLFEMGVEADRQMPSMWEYQTSSEK